MKNEKNQISENIFKIVNPKAIAAASGVLGAMGKIKALSEDDPKEDPTPTATHALNLTLTVNHIQWTTSTLPVPGHARI